MKPRALISMQTKPSIIRKLPKPLKFLLIVFAGLAIVTFSLIAGNFVRCHTVDFCDYVRPTMSPEMIATHLPVQYEYAIQDINAGRLKAAKQRLSYIVFHNPEYPNAKEQLLEVEQLLAVTPTP